MYLMIGGEGTSELSLILLVFCEACSMQPRATAIQTGFHLLFFSRFLLLLVPFVHNSLNKATYVTNSGVPLIAVLPKNEKSCIIYSPECHFKPVQLSSEEFKRQYFDELW